jgi:type II secretory ATPase GspE/PulE/Tfp pilus assembly ATPase PilB-like protein
MLGKLFKKNKKEEHNAESQLENLLQQQEEQEQITIETEGKEKSKKGFKLPFFGKGKKEERQTEEEEHTPKFDTEGKDLKELIDLMPISEEKKTEWKNILSTTPQDYRQLFEELLTNFQLPLTVEELYKKALTEKVPPLVYLCEIERLITYDEVLNFWQGKYGIKVDTLFTALEVINPFNTPKRVGEFLFGDGIYSKHEIAIYSPAEFSKAVEILAKGFLEGNEKYKRYAYEDVEIVLVKPQLFENKELLKEVETEVKKEGENLLKKFKEILKVVIQMGVSDIHFSPKSSIVEVKVRLFGDLVPFMHLTHPEWRAMMRVIKNLARDSGSIIDVDEWRIAQDAKATLEEFGVDLRLAFTPSLIEKEQYLVIRILYRGQSIKVEKGKEVELIESLGYFEEDAKFFAEYIQTKEKGQGGILIMAGATGSGKSKTLNSMLALIPPKRAIKTIEDPVEYRLDNADQHEVMIIQKGSELLKFDFLEAVKEFMRQDPDIIFIGEWRKNPELTSAITYESKTGHFVLTTLHSSRVVNIPDLLYSDYQVDQPTQANNLSVLISQRLLKTVCSNCGLTEEIDYTTLVEELPKIPFIDNRKLLEILDAFENPNIKIHFSNIDLKSEGLINIGKFHQILEEISANENLIKIEIPETFESEIKTVKQIREEKRLHKITDKEKYEDLLKKAIKTVIDGYLEAFHKASKGKQLTEEDKKLLRRMKFAIEEFIDGNQLVKKINLRKFLKYFLYTGIREHENIDRMRQLVRYYSPKINTQGCSECIKTNPITGEVVSAGVKGRTPIYEFVIFDQEARELIFKTTEALEFEKLLNRKKWDFIINKDRSFTPKGKSFMDTFVEKLKEGYKWNVPYSEIVKLKQ